MFIVQSVLDDSMNLHCGSSMGGLPSGLFIAHSINIFCSRTAIHITEELEIMFNFFILFIYIHLSRPKAVVFVGFFRRCR